MRGYSCGTTYKSINVNIITEIVVVVAVVAVVGIVQSRMPHGRGDPC